MSRRYKDDPFWMQSKFRSKCSKCGQEITKGEHIFYYPIGRSAYCKVCGEDASAAFESMAEDEDMYVKWEGYEDSSY